MSRCLLSSLVLPSNKLSIFNSRALSKTGWLNNHYDTLKVPTSASLKEIKDSYFKLSKKYHPDLNPNDAQCHDRFIKLQEAYQVLSNTESRRKYDQSVLGHRSLMGSSPSSSPNRPYGYPDFTQRDEWLKRSEQARREAEFRKEFGAEGRSAFNRFYSKPHNLNPEEYAKYYKKSKTWSVNSEKLTLLLFVCVLGVSFFEALFNVARKHNVPSFNDNIHHHFSHPRYSNNPLIQQEMMRIEREKYRDEEYKKMLKRNSVENESNTNHRD